MEKITPFLEKVLSYTDPQHTFTEESLHPQMEKPSQAKAMEKFVSRIEKARQNKDKILVAGDYDCDGVLATSIMVSGLRSLGIETGFYIPNRIKEGYGIHENTVQMAHDKGYSLIVTVDNGVKAFPALQKARELGMEVIVTDHHTIEQEVEPVSLLVHPSLLEEPFHYLCGAALAFECLRALKADTPEHLMWAAIASIADCMPVKAQTRAIIQAGLKVLNRDGEMHLMALSKDRHVTDTSAAYQIVPAVNSVGRLANRANVNNLVRYFLTRDPRAVYDFADKIQEVNNARKSMTEMMAMKAAAKIKPARPVLLAADPSFHEGIVGLIAGQLCSQFGKPAIVGAQNENCIKCSMRSPEGFHCLEFLNKFPSYQAIGGHAQAAGFSVALEDWKEFEKFVFQQGLKEKWEPKENTYIPLELNEMTVDNVEALDALRPFGPGLEEPAFVLENPQIHSIFDLSQGRHRKFGLGNNVYALNFNQSGLDQEASATDIEALKGHLSLNEYQGRKSVNLIVDEIEYVGQ